MPRKTQMPEELSAHGFTLLITRKPIRHVYLRICSKSGRVKISAPLRASKAAILDIVARKADWLHRHCALHEQRREKQRLYCNGERHLFLGQEYSLKICSKTGPGYAKLGTGGEIELHSPPGANPAYLQNLLWRWYRNELLKLAETLRLQWQEKMGVCAAELRVRKMRTRWGSCNTIKKRIWLNLELAKKDPACIEYVLVHELAHLIERGHGKAFWAVVESHLPHWRSLRAKLNATPPQ
ncbi:MAG: M48 family metallopeptidase [Desulfovibrionaceae bacterium]|nr:M48 family metallopeptidase [Desulfovibrionaceae bacterium]